MKETECESVFGCICFFRCHGRSGLQEDLPALQAMIRRGRFDMPSSEWQGAIGLLISFDSAPESLEAHDGVDSDAFARLSARLQYISGDYRTKGPMHGCERPLVTLSSLCIISPFHRASFRPWPGDCPGPVAPRMPVSSWRSPSAATLLRPGAQPDPSPVFPESAIFRIDHYLGKERSRTWNISVLLIPSWSRSGTAITWRGCRSPCAKASD